MPMTAVGGSKMSATGWADGPPEWATVSASLLPSGSMTLNSAGVLPICYLERRGYRVLHANHLFLLVGVPGLEPGTL